MNEIDVALLLDCISLRLRCESVGLVVYVIRYRRPIQLVDCMCL